MCIKVKIVFFFKQIFFLYKKTLYLQIVNQ